MVVNKDGADPSTDGYLARSTALAIFVKISQQQVTTRGAALYAGGFYTRGEFQLHMLVGPSAIQVITRPGWVSSRTDRTIVHKAMIYR